MFINENLYVSQSLGFEEHENSNFILKINQALYGLKHALIAWYECLSGFLIKKGISLDNMNTNLFNKT